MKKLLILLSLIVSVASYSTVTLQLDVNATLVEPLSLETNTNNLVGTAVVGKAVNMSEVNLIARGTQGREVKIVAPAKVTLQDRTVGSTQRIELDSKFGTPENIVGTTLETEVQIDATTGEGLTTYSLEGTVPSTITLPANGQADFVGNADITVAYN